MRRRQRKQRTKMSIALDVAFVVLVCVIIFSVWKISDILTDYRSSQKLYESLQEEYTAAGSEIPEGEQISSMPGEQPDVPEERPSTSEKAARWYGKKTVDLEGLREFNPDIVGWLYQEDGEQIDYPILYSGDNQKYLRRLPDGSGATAGSIFLEAANSPDFADSHTILYGHNMRNLSMFGTLKNYRDPSYYETHQYFQLFTEKEILRYRVFAYSVVDDDSPVYAVPFAPGEEFAGFIETLYESSELATDVTVTDADRILTMSTCSGDHRRFVVHAVLTDIY